MTSLSKIENKLAKFIASLALTPKTQAAYRADPESTMAEAGLSEDQKAVLRGGDWRSIIEMIELPDERPLAEEQAGGKAEDGDEITP